MLQKRRYEEILHEQERRGEKGFGASMKAISQSISEMNAEMRRRHAERMAKMGGNNQFTASAAMMAASDDDGQARQL